ncbi:MAG: type I-C CRISPR-associated protein Cas8c/Csd1, partial [Candidatus Omnitrophica bacterium]|nr:type I-C CRISPR-associated protein Cas8c/Csd1 [Candidatus Omnitrophota bacterium]
VSDWNNYKFRVACPEMGVLVSNNLPRSAANDKNGISAFGGKGRHSGLYPDPNLPAIGNAYLFSMNEDAPCHNRYGKIASEIFPTSADEVKAMHGALKWCVKESCQGKTWGKVPSHRLGTRNGKKIQIQDLLITYLEEKPQSAIDLASTFTTFDTTEDEIGEAVYEKMTAKVCDALKGESGLTKDSKANILVITKVDKGRAQVVLSGAYSIENIIRSIEQWQIAAKNRPHFSIFLPGKKGEKAKVVEPFCPSPAEIMRCLQNQWIKKGIDSRKVSGVALRHVYELFLGNERILQETARMFLQLTLQRLGPLFIGITKVNHGGDVKDFKLEARKSVLVGISLLAIVLYKLGIKKEDYMRNTAFSVGRLLALADGLHAQYCMLQMKRKGGDLPPQLIGNAHLPIAFDSPNKALALLGERLRIYYAWATKVQGDEYKLVKWMLGEMGKLSAEMENVAWPSMADDAVKAQVLLGYLARYKSEE